jgi:hypothetical protein
MASATAAALPTLQTIIEGMTGRDAQNMPKFQNAQQAMAYLYLSVEPEQIADCFVGETAEEKREKAEKMIKSFDQFSRVRDEAGMLTHAEPVIRHLLAKSSFRARATPEQIVAAQFLTGRAAMYRVMEDLDDEA